LPILNLISCFRFGGQKVHKSKVGLKGKGREDVKGGKGRLSEKRE